MKQTWGTKRFAATTVLALAAALLAGAVPPGAPWVARDIGTPPAPGATDVDANGVWTITGSGQIFFTHADAFHFAYQRLAGDASITARYVSMQFGAGGAELGLMVRADEFPGAPGADYFFTNVGLAARVRLQQYYGAGFLGFLGPTSSPRREQQIRLQRVGQEIGGYYSLDGRVWSPDFEPVLLAGLSHEALFGLRVASWEEKARTGKLDQVQVQAGALLVPGLRTYARDQEVQLKWRALPNALAYRVYRGPAGATPDQLRRLDIDSLTATSFTDRGPHLVNGAALTYAVAAVLPGPDGAPVEGPLVVTPARPVAAPPGWLGCSLQEGPAVGSVSYDAGRNEVALRGSGSEIGGNTDGGYFLSQAIEGDFRITVKVAGFPAGAGGCRMAGLMIRELLDASARNLWIGLRPAGCFLEGLAFQGRLDTYGPTDGAIWVNRPQVTLPILLRLTRQGDRLIPEYSADDGRTFQLGRAAPFDPPLPGNLFAGLAVSGGNGGGPRTALSEGKFTLPVIEKR